MCIAVLKPKGVPLPRNFHDIIKSCMRANQDGSGFAVKKNNTNNIIMKKGYWYPNLLMADLEAYHISENDELLFHARRGTSGSNDNKNCHPFYTSSSPSLHDTVCNSIPIPVIAHNGIIREFDKQDNFCDSAHLAFDFLSKNGVYDIFVNAPAYLEEMYSEIFQNNKMIALFPNRSAYVFGLSKFIQDNGLLYSNTSYKTYSNVITMNFDGELNYDKDYDNEDVFGPSKRICGGIVSSDRAPIKPIQGFADRSWKKSTDFVEGNTTTSDMPTKDVSIYPIHMKRKYGTFTINSDGKLGVFHQGISHGYSTTLSQRGIMLNVSLSRPRFEFAENHFLSVIKAFGNESALSKLKIISRTIETFLNHSEENKIYRVLKLYKTGILIENKKHGIKRWVNPIELFYNYTMTYANDDKTVD
jgi:hypothetical protein